MIFLLKRHRTHSSVKKKAHTTVLIVSAHDRGGTRVMKSEWESMTIDELFALREQMQLVLAAKLHARKTALERQLQKLNDETREASAAKRRQP
jgi:hypothetical protein